MSICGGNLCLQFVTAQYDSIIWLQFVVIAICEAVCDSN